MSDPRRWLEEPDAPAGLAELLDSARLDEPTGEQLAKLRSAIGFLFIPPGGGGGDGGGGADGGGLGDGGLSGGGAAAGGGGSVVAGAVATGVVGKTVGIALTTLVVAGLGGSVLLRNLPESRTPDPTPVVVVAPAPIAEPIAEPDVVVAAPPAPVVAAPRPRPAPAPVLAPAPVAEPETTKETPPVPAPAPTAQTEDEVDLLQEAMSAAQSGRSADALAAVDGHVRAFPSSPLAQEREAIAIEALVNLGRVPEAKSRLEKFRSKWPTSTHLLRLESLIP